MRSIAFSQDGNIIICGYCDNTIKLWEKATGTLLKTFEGYKNPLISVTFSPNGNIIVSESSDKKIKLWKKELF